LDSERSRRGDPWIQKKEELNMLYTTVKTLTVGYSSGNIPVKDERVVKLSQVVDNLKRWQEYLHSFLNHPKPENTAPLFEVTQNIDIEIKLRGKGNPRNQGHQKDEKDEARSSRHQP